MIPGYPTLLLIPLLNICSCSNSYLAIIN
ncbi:Loki-CTERM sorting domain-containing protein [Umezakia sp. BLCC-F215]